MGKKAKNKFASAKKAKASLREEEKGSSTSTEEIPTKGIVQLETKTEEATEKKTDTKIKGDCAKPDSTTTNGFLQGGVVDSDDDTPPSTTLSKKRKSVPVLVSVEESPEDIVTPSKNEMLFNKAKRRKSVAAPKEK